MAVNFGSNEIKVYLGNKEVTSIHFGEEEVYKKPSTEAPITLVQMATSSYRVAFSKAGRYLCTYSASGSTIVLDVPEDYESYTVSGSSPSEHDYLVGVGIANSGQYRQINTYFDTGSVWEEIGIAEVGYVTWDSDGNIIFNQTAKYLGK